MWIETIATFGDSITYGVGDTTALGWVGRLRKRVEADHATQVYNFGVSGDTSTDLLRRLQSECESVEPDLILIAIGTNDSIYRKGDESTRQTPLSEYKENLLRLVEAAKANAKHVGIVGLTTVTESLVQPIPWSETGKSYKRSILEEYDTAAKEVALSQDALYISMWDALAAEDLADGLHPNDSGYEKMYERIHVAIKPVLQPGGSVDNSL